MHDYKVKEDLYLITNRESSEYGRIYFCGDSFYGYYTIAEFDEMLCQIVSTFLKIRSGFVHPTDIYDDEESL